MNNEFERHSTENKKHWLKLRTEVITSTELAAIYNNNKYLSITELYHRKKNKDASEITKSEAMEMGLALESAIAKRASEQFNLDINKENDFFIDRKNKIGSSFDYTVTDTTEVGVGVLEIKNVGEFSFKNGWTVEGENEATAPLMTQFQLQMEMELMNAKFGYIVACVGGRKLYIKKYYYEEILLVDAKERIKSFWQSVEDGIAPKVETEADANFIIDWYKKSDPLKKVTASISVELELSKYIEAKKMYDIHAKQVKLSKAKILSEVEDSCIVNCRTHDIALSQVAGRKGTEITQEMVGNVINKSKGSRRFTVKEKS